MANILVCDDDKEIVEAISIYLSQEGYQIFKAYNGREAIEVLQKEDIQLLLIDIMMPEMDGIHAMIKIRTFSAIPILVLSAKSEDVDKILGLNVGADDYITKPFNPLELVARVKSSLRRYTMLGSCAGTKKNYVVGSLEIDDEAKIVTVDGEQVRLLIAFASLQFRRRRHVKRRHVQPTHQQSGIDQPAEQPVDRSANLRRR